MKLIELHILQSFPVSCLNRDDVGSPKSAQFGGVRRARISSQCLSVPHSRTFCITRRNNVYWTTFPGRLRRPGKTRPTEVAPPYDGLPCPSVPRDFRRTRKSNVHDAGSSGDFCRVSPEEPPCIGFETNRADCSPASLQGTGRRSIHTAIPSAPSPRPVPYRHFDTHT